MSDIVKNKQELRILLRRKREELGHSYRFNAENVIYDRLFSSDAYKNADTVLAYYPIGSEFNTLPIIAKALEDSKKIAFPISNREDYTLDFRYVNDMSVLTRGAYSIPEPSKSAEQYVLSDNSICIVPALAFDICGHRLGYGKGFYDRFLSNYNGTSIGLVYGDFLLESLPHEPTDIPVDMIISEREELFICEKKNK